MASHRRPVSLDAPVSCGRPRVEPRPLLGGHPLDPANGNAVERFIKIVPFTGHLLAQIARVDNHGAVRQSVGALPRTTGREGPDLRGGSFGRRHVCPGKKGAHWSARPSAAGNQDQGSDRRAGNTAVRRDPQRVSRRGHPDRIAARPPSVAPPSVAPPSPATDLRSRGRQRST